MADNDKTAATPATPAAKKTDAANKDAGKPGELHPLQSEEARREVLERTGTGASASGQAREDMLRDDNGDDPLNTEGDDRGSTVPIAEPPEEGKPLEKGRDAIMLTNGVLRAGRVATPGGPMPASAFPDGAARLARQQEAINEPYPRSGDGTALTDEQMARMSAAELRAVAIDRGYPILPGGKRATLAAFQKHQGDDKGLKKSEKSKR